MQKNSQTVRKKIEMISRILGTAFRVHCIFPKKEISSGITMI